MVLLGRRSCALLPASLLRLLLLLLLLLMMMMMMMMPLLLLLLLMMMMMMPLLLLPLVPTDVQRTLWRVVPVRQVSRGLLLASRGVTGAAMATAVPPRSRRQRVFGRRLLPNAAAASVAALPRQGRAVPEGAFVPHRPSACALPLSLCCISSFEAAVMGQA